MPALFQLPLEFFSVKGLFSSVNLSSTLAVTRFEVQFLARSGEFRC